jgi:hypothetical protein
VEAEAHIVPAVPRISGENEHSGDHARPRLPVLEPRPGGLAERFSARFGPENPVRVFVVALLAGDALLVTAMVFLGLVMIYLVLPLGGLGESDEDLSEWLADNRSPGQEDLSWIGSTLAGGLVIPVVIGLCLLVFLVTRHWLLAAFVLFAVAPSPRGKEHMAPPRSIVSSCTSQGVRLANATSAPVRRRPVALQRSQLAL